MSLTCWAATAAPIAEYTVSSSACGRGHGRTSSSLLLRGWPPHWANALSLRGASRLSTPAALGLGLSPGLRRPAAAGGHAVRLGVRSALAGQQVVRAADIRAVLRGPGCPAPVGQVKQ